MSAICMMWIGAPVTAVAVEVTDDPVEVAGLVALDDAGLLLPQAPKASAPATITAADVMVKRARCGPLLRFAQLESSLTGG